MGSTGGFRRPSRFGQNNQSEAMKPDEAFGNTRSSPMVGEVTYHLSSNNGASGVL
jgi:hypothetical protein